MRSPECTLVPSARVTAALAAMLPVVLSLYFIRGVTWFVVVRAAGQPVGFGQAIRITFISQMFVFLPGGDLWKVPLVRLAKGGRVDTGVLTGTVVFDDLIYLFVLTFAMVPLVIGAPLLSIPLAVALLPQLVIFAILLSPSVYGALASRVGNLGPFRRFRSELAVLGPSFRSLVRIHTTLKRHRAGCAGRFPVHLTVCARSRIRARNRIRSPARGIHLLGKPGGDQSNRDPRSTGSVRGDDDRRHGAAGCRTCGSRDGRPPLSHRKRRADGADRTRGGARVRPGSPPRDRADGRTAALATPG